MYSDIEHVTIPYNDPASHLAQKGYGFSDGSHLKMLVRSDRPTITVSPFELDDLKRIMFPLIHNATKVDNLERFRNYCSFDNAEKSVWRSIKAYMTNGHFHTIVLNYDFNKGELTNTGVTPLRTGDVVYAMPPLQHTVEHFNTHKYIIGLDAFLYPTLLSERQYSMLVSDCVNAINDIEFNPNINGLSYLSPHVSSDLLRSISSYVFSLRSIGWVKNKKGCSTLDDGVDPIIYVGQTFVIEYRPIYM